MRIPRPPLHFPFPTPLNRAPSPPNFFAGAPPRRRISPSSPATVADRTAPFWYPPLPHDRAQPPDPILYFFSAANRRFRARHEVVIAARRLHLSEPGASPE